jgi:hypothetical protein
MGNVPLLNDTLTNECLLGVVGSELPRASKFKFRRLGDDFSVSPSTCDALETVAKSAVKMRGG